MWVGLEAYKSYTFHFKNRYILMEKILLVLAFLDCIIAHVFDPDEDTRGDPFVAWEEHKVSGYTIGSASRSITNYCSSLGLASKTLKSCEGNQEFTVNSTNPVAVPVDGKLPSLDVTRVGQESVESSPARAPASFLTTSFSSAEEFRPPGGSASIYFHVQGVRLNVVVPSTELDASASQLECHVIDIQVASNGQSGGRSRVLSPMDLGKIFLGLTYQAVVSFVIFRYQAAGNSSSQDGSPEPSPLLQIAEVSLVVGFTASLNGILLRQAYPEKAMIIEKLGSVASSISFFLMMSMVLKSVSEWICWLGAAESLLAFLLGFIKSKTD